MNVLFLGGIFNRAKEKEILKKSKKFMNVAANAHQWHILNGIKNRKDINLSVLNTVFVGTYPREYTDIYIPGGEWNEPGLSVREIGYINLFGVRSVIKAFSLYFRIKEWCKAHCKGIDNADISYKSPCEFNPCKASPEPSEKEKNIILIYSMNTPFLIASYFAKKRFKNIKLCLYVPDLPYFFYI
ncbi:MAG TPA: hypothetical protein GXX37_01480 [Clostridiaceae bacterium]|nr:hypothetical protein [Clostridiaceae bacterium]